jgi:hypothetical protein
MGSNGRVPFPSQSGYSELTLSSSHKGYSDYVQNYFTQRKYHGIHWLDGFWQNGDYLCGNDSTIYNGGRCGNTYTLYSHQKAYHTGSPELKLIGNTHDWYRYFATYYVRAQYRYANANSGHQNYDSMGSIWDDYCDIHSVTCAYGPGHMSTIMGGLVLTPAVFNPKPIPLGDLSPTVVSEGCVPGNGSVSFIHSDSFHPNSDSRIVLYQWDVDRSNGLWWETGANADLDANGEPLVTDDPNKEFEFVYTRKGSYVPTLRVTDNTEQHKELTLQSVTVNAADNVPPSVATGGPYIIDEGQNLRLIAVPSDLNLTCGDSLSVSWDLDNNGTYEQNGSTVLLRWNTSPTLQNLPKNQAN